ncbi:hypothetical protein CANCADRAFT_81135 [Tortispora caseinolytica NRRL Y-17796]|uniref:Uncharacterized protein n=1 Tax=Tortispora caseinolytica NRRL Y-17796 TaxID=767744 RepID=A0A1E4TJU5_9ASCO|nr:hypothetical protein CANCADRAFT_81135 [Tortispora caseinolytica NRRL Y-17796]
MSQDGKVHFVPRVPVGQSASTQIPDSKFTFKEELPATKAAVKAVLQEIDKVEEVKLSSSGRAAEVEVEQELKPIAEAVKRIERLLEMHYDIAISVACSISKTIGKSAWWRRNEHNNAVIPRIWLQHLGTAFKDLREISNQIEHLNKKISTKRAILCEPSSNYDCMPLDQYIVRNRQRENTSTFSRSVSLPSAAIREHGSQTYKLATSNKAEYDYQQNYIPRPPTAVRKLAQRAGGQGLSIEGPAVKPAMFHKPSRYWN